MLKKRLIGVVTVKQGYAVQSFGFGRWLPLGKPEVLVENLDRWGADEIVLQCIDRSSRQLGPDVELLARVSRKGLATPLVYAGGIRSGDDARAVIQAGADRIAIDALLRDDLARIPDIARVLGAQALIAALPLSRNGNSLSWYDYRKRSETPLSDSLLDLLTDGTISEAMIVDWRNEGKPGGFDQQLLTLFPRDDIPLIAFGGLSAPAQLREAFANPRIVAAGVGNFLNYSEHALQHFKESQDGVPLRPAAYEAL